jgi:hypothetical protein
MGSLIDDPAKAQKLAIAIAKDLSLYNGDKIKKARSLDDLLSNVMKEEIAEGGKLFRVRVAPQHYDLFEPALIEVLGTHFK